MSKEKTPGYLGYIGDEILPSCVGITEDHYKDPYQTTSIMESRSSVFVAQVSCYRGHRFLFLGDQASSQYMAILREFLKIKVHCLGWCHIVTS